MRIGSERRIFRHPENPPINRLYEIKDAWADAPELPLAYADPHNLITAKSRQKWLELLKLMDERNLLPYAIAEKYPRPLTDELLLAEYRRLHFLSAESAQQGLTIIAADIARRFPPETTLIILQTGSCRWLYKKYLAAALADYGTVGWQPDVGPAIQSPGKFRGSQTSQAAKLLYIDDWILSGTQLGEQIFPYPESLEQLFTYHLVASDRGQYLYQKHGINGCAVYRLTGDKGPQCSFGDHPVYGFHKIPDLLSAIYADSVRHRYPDYSIFPRIDGSPIGRHSRLAY